MESGLPTSGTRTDSVWRIGRSLSHSDALGAYIELSQ